MKTFCIVAFILMLGARAFAADFCNAEERAYDKEHRELLNLPQGSVSERGRTIPRAPQGGLRLCALNKRELPRLHSARVNKVMAARL